MDKKKTGLLIKEARTTKNYTQSELGDLIGVSNKAVSRWENGESFPDIGVLEILSRTLELPIQDIVMGESSKEDDKAVVEVVRIAKMQVHEKRGQIIKYVVGIIAIIYMSFLCAMGLSSYGTINVNWTVVYAVSYLVITILILGSALHEKRMFEVKLYDKNVIQIVIPIVTYILEILVLCIFFSSIGKGKIPFNMELHIVGSVLNTFLSIIFLINLLFFIYAYYGMVRNEHKVNYGIFISSATIFLSGVNGELLHNLNTFERVLTLLWTNIGVFLVEMIVAVMIGVCLSRNRK